MDGTYKFYHSERIILQFLKEMKNNILKLYFKKSELEK